MNLKINNTNINVEVFRFENTQNAKHKKVGFVTLIINELIKIKGINLMENTETKEFWLSLPQELVKGKYQPLVIMSKEDKQAIVDVIVGKDKGGAENAPQTDENKNDVPWESELEF